jgi:hypothetical protein
MVPGTPRVDLVHPEPVPKTCPHPLWLFMKVDFALERECVKT